MTHYWAAASEASRLSDKGRATTYGEVERQSFLTVVLSQFRSGGHPDPVFLDLGSGDGSLVLIAGLCWGVPAFGVELVGTRHFAAKGVLCGCERSLGVVLSHIVLAHGDACTHPLPDATHVFINNFVFDASLNASLLSRLAAMPSVKVVSEFSLLHPFQPHTTPSPLLLLEPLHPTVPAPTLQVATLQRLCPRHSSVLCGRHKLEGSANHCSAFSSVDVAFGVVHVSWADKPAPVFWTRR